MKERGNGGKARTTKKKDNREETYAGGRDDVSAEWRERERMMEE